VLSYNQPVASQIAACPNHPAREAIGICVRCRGRLCSECATKVDGINYCAACLGALASRPAPARQAERGPLARQLTAAAYVLTLALAVWGLFELAFAVRPS
jgi:hypothetical protein